jgi:GT2 family glycosyltransferase
MKISVIIPCYNSATTIEHQLEALANQTTLPWEVIIADNGSTDDSMKIAKNFSRKIDRLRIIDASDRRGASHARNTGAKAATGEAILFCDSDDVVAPGWVEAMATALTKHDFVASKFETFQLNSKESLKLHNGGDHPQCNGLTQHLFQFLPYAGGCGLGVKRYLHESVGGFDESILYHEDTDYCWKLQLSGIKLHFIPEAIIHIRYRDTPVSRLRQIRLWSNYEVLLYKKYRALGVPEISSKQSLKEWIIIFKRLIKVSLGKERFDDLVGLLGARLGRLQGSIKYRTLLL